MPEIGSQVGPYRIVQKLGRGGMGEVVQAWDTRLERNVALKFLDEPGGRFRIEAQAIAALQHPNVCAIFDIGPDYLVLEYLDGESPRGQIPENEISVLLRQVVSALHAAHQRGILHRDLKPGNMMRLKDGTLKLLDFGLARRADNDDVSATMTLAGSVVGTPAYMSPEQARGEPLDVRSDLFSLGCVLYEWLAGKAPYDRGSTIATLSALLDGRPPESPSTAGGPLWELARRCLERDPARRPQSAQEILDQLSQPAAVTAEAREPAAIRLLVLPLASLTSDRDDEYFAVGLADDLVNQISRSPDLFVFARTTAHTVRHLHWDLAAIAQKLRATHVLDGSVRRAGGRLRVTLQLAETGSGRQLWTDRYDRPGTDLFAVQDEIAAAVCTQLDAHFLRRSTMELPATAHDHWLRARHLTMAPSAADHVAAAAEYEQALALAPGNPRIAADFGFLHLYRVQLGEVAPLAALAAARECLAISGKNGADEPPVRGLGALIATVGDYDWARGDELIRGAGGEVGANWGRLGHAIWGLRNRGLFREAQRVVDDVHALDPLSPFVSAAQQALFYQWRKYDECVKLGFQMMGQLAAFWQAAWVACSALLAQQRWAECHVMLSRALAASPGQPVLLWTQAVTFQREGRIAEFRQMRVRLEMEGVPLIPYLRSLLALYQGDTEEAFDWLEASVELRDLSAGQLMLDHHWDALRSHLRFQAILDRMNCPPHLRGPIPPEVFAA